MKDIKTKVYGFIMMTKKTFIIVEGAIIFLIIIALIATYFYYDQPYESYTSSFDRFMANYGLFFWLMFIVWGIIEMQFFLHRFTKAQLNVIEKQKEEISQQKEEILTQNDEISAQRDLLVKQKDYIEQLFSNISKSIDYAERLQEAILPDTDMLKDKLDGIFVFFHPKDLVSGDFYWWTILENHTIITAADCTGHGVPGAFMSMLGISYLREIVMKEEITHSGIILNRLRQEIINTLKQKGTAMEQKDGMDMSLISINHENNVLQFSGANNPMYLIRNDELHEYNADRMPIAIYDNMSDFNTHEINIKKNDHLYLFSDGFSDQFGGPDGKKFKYKQLKQTLLEIHNKPMDEQKNLLEKKFLAWKGDQEQTDDVLIIGIKI